MRIHPVVLVFARLVGVARARYMVGGLLWSLFFVIPILTGLILKGLFDQISGQRAATLDATLWLCAAFVAVEMLRGLTFFLALSVWPYWWHSAETTLRTNALRSILTARGPAATRLPHSSGEAVSRFRDDVFDVVRMVDSGVDLVGAVAFGVVAFVIMSSIDPVVTLVLVVPLTIVLLLTRLMSSVIRRIHGRARRLGAAVTAYIGELFGGVLAIKTAGAEAAVLERLRTHNARRRQAAVKDRLTMDLLDTATSATVELSIGLVLLLAAPAMRRGDFTVGDLALFTSYVGWLTMLPRVIGRMLYRVPQSAVAIERMTRLMASYETADDLSRHTKLWLTEQPPPALEAIPPRSDRLQVLEVDGLTAGYDGMSGVSSQATGTSDPAGSRAAARNPDSRGRGVRNVSLRVPRGSFTIITGAVGSGKTTLVRAVLGLLPATSGVVRWNGQPIADPGTFLVPNRAAYVGQVPRLFSETLRENLLLGWPVDDEDLAHALRLAALDRDLDEMPFGLDTVVGPRGVRLSGGQVQRATAARALARQPDLLVVDDLSSALDVETEELLWDRIAEASRSGHGPSTLLVVSHRRAALRRADQIVVLDRGEVVGVGSLDELLRTCPEMRRLWADESIGEAQPQPT